MSVRRGIALTVGFIVLAAAPVTIDLVRSDDRSDDRSGAADSAETSTTVYRSHVAEDQ